MRPRAIPVLLMGEGGLVKSVNFKKPKYIGDPVNAIKIFNDLEVDEIIFLDTLCSKEKREPDYQLIEEFASECFMPLCYGGGVRNLEQMEKIFHLGVEKISLNQAALNDLEFVKNAVYKFGSQSIIAAVDITKTLFGQYKIFDYLNSRNANVSMDEWFDKIQEIDVGEVLVQAVNKDGEMGGYDLALVENLSKKISMPLIVCGGAGSVADLRSAIDYGAHAAAAGSLFIYKSKHKGVLINYPTQEELKDEFFKDNLSTKGRDT